MKKTMFTKNDDGSADLMDNFAAVSIYITKRRKNTLARYLCFTVLGLLFSMHSIYAQTGAALNFDGLSTYVGINAAGATATNFTTTSSFTIEAWINPAIGSAGWNAIFGHKNSSTFNPGYTFELLNDSLYFEGTNTFTTGGGGIVSNGVWTHVAMVYDSGNITFYINGIVSGTSTGQTITPPSPANAVLGTYTNGWGYFTGSIDELRIWGKKLTSCEISAHMNCEIHGPQSALLINYHFNEGIAGGTNTTITTAYDSSGNGYDGTLGIFALTGPTSNWVAPGGVVSATTCIPDTCSGALSVLTPVAELFDALKIYPNPNHGIFTINILSAKNELADVIVMNMAGQRIMAFKAMTNQNVPIAIDNNNGLKPGVYFISTVVTEKRFFVKITVD